MTQNVEKARELDSLSLHLALHTSKQLISHNVGLLPPCPKFAQVQVLVGFLYESVAFLQVRERDTMLLIRALPLMLLQIVCFRNQAHTLLRDSSAAAANNTNNIAITVELPLCPSKIARPHLLPLVRDDTEAGLRLLLPRHSHYMRSLSHGRALPLALRITHRRHNGDF